MSNPLEPNIQLFASAPGTAAAGEGEDPTKKQKPAATAPGAGEEGNPADPTGTEPPADDGLPKTQEELDALIEKRLKREQKKWAKQQVAQPAAKPAAQAPATAVTSAGEPAAQPATPAVAAPDNTELLKAQRGLVETRAQLTAIKSGVNPAAVEDAVLLAIHEVEKDGDDPDDENVADALKEVLKRHPEWKADKGSAGMGFRVGAGGGDPQQATTDMLNEAFGLTT